MSDQAHAIRQAVPEDQGAVAQTVTAAFAADPAWAFIVGDRYERLALHFASALFDVRVRSQNVWVSDGLTAVAMWDAPVRPDRSTPSEHARRTWARYRELAGEDAFARLTRYNEAVAAASPTERYWYLGVLATHPDHRRKGLATAVLRPMLERADGSGADCCLETSTAENRRFYERRGFTQARDVRLAGGPMTWWLTRPPQSAV